MHLTQRKKSTCQNCQYPLLETYNFCPNCSQENSEKRVSFGTLILELLNNYLSYDSRLGRTIIPFLFQPGYLTNEFIAGRRIKYMHPLRLYFAASFLYFLIFSIIISPQINKEINFNSDASPPIPSADSLRKQIKQGIAEDEDIPQDVNVVVDSVTKALSANTEFDLPTDSVSTRKKNKKSAGIGELLKMPGITPEQVLDSIGVDKSDLNTMLAKQAIKLTNEKGDTILNYLISKASIMMFLLLPFFALTLKLFYVRRKRYYMEHVTFTLHIHSFLFFILFLAMLINYQWPNDWVYSISVFLIFIYFLFSFKMVYRQGWMKTLLKMFILFNSYAISFTIFMIVTIVISLLIY